MNRALLIIVIPALLVAAGYIAVFRYMGISAGYPRLIGTLALFFVAIIWLSRRTARKAGSERS